MTPPPEPERATTPVLAPDDTPTRRESDALVAARALREAMTIAQDAIETLVPCPLCKGEPSCALCSGSGMVTPEVRREALHLP